MTSAYLGKIAFCQFLDDVFIIIIIEKLYTYNNNKKWNHIKSVQFHCDSIVWKY